MKKIEKFCRWLEKEDIHTYWYNPNLEIEKPLPAFTWQENRAVIYKQWGYWLLFCLEPFTSDMDTFVKTDFNLTRFRKLSLESMKAVALHEKNKIINSLTEDD